MTQATTTPYSTAQAVADPFVRQGYNPSMATLVSAAIAMEYDKGALQSLLREEIDEVSQCQSDGRAQSAGEAAEYLWEKFDMEDTDEDIQAGEAGHVGHVTISATVNGKKTTARFVAEDPVYCDDYGVDFLPVAALAAAIESLSNIEIFGSAKEYLRYLVVECGADFDTKAGAKHDWEGLFRDGEDSDLREAFDNEFDTIYELVSAKVPGLADS